MANNGPKWSSFMVHMCQRVISPGLFCIFFQILIFGVNSEVKGQNMAQNDKKFCLSHSVFQEAYIIRSWFLAHLTCKMMTSPDAFFIFSNFYFLSCEGGWGGGVGGKNWPKMSANSVCLAWYFIWLDMNLTSYDCGFVTHL